MPSRISKYTFWDSSTHVLIKPISLVKIMASNTIPVELLSKIDLSMLGLKTVWQ